MAFYPFGVRKTYRGISAFSGHNCVIHQPPSLYVKRIGIASQDQHDHKFVTRDPHLPKYLNQLASQASLEQLQDDPMLLPAAIGRLPSDSKDENNDLNNDREIAES
ncbi:hypothetical protein ACFX13_046173 [Malus domestica]